MHIMAGSVVTGERIGGSQSDNVCWVACWVFEVEWWVLALLGGAVCMRMTWLKMSGRILSLFDIVDWNLVE
jgi:hypothetical protein